jgi:hypothetical protein
MLDYKPLVKGSRFSAGPLRARGVPAILLGVASIVAARGITVALVRGAGILPETLREARALWLAVRAQREMLA